jgi:UDP-N-acetyl-D-glucosamine dehydrogenase
MANYVVWRIQDMLNRSGKSLSGSTILCLGAAFKAGVSDVRNSRALHVMELLQKQGASILYCDPHVPKVKIGDTALSSVDPKKVSSEKFDAVAVLVGAANWPMAELEKTGKPIFDAVNAGGAPNGQRERL